LVWCHGLGSSRAGDRDVIDALSETFTVLAYDARGHGESAPVTDEALYTYPAMSRDLRALVEHLGWDRGVFAGASMGAATAARVAMEEPERVSALIMARPGSAGTAASQRLQILFRLGGEAIRSGGWDAAIEFLLTIPEVKEQLNGNRSRLDMLRAEWSRHDPASIAAALIGISASPPLTPELDVNAITARVLVIPATIRSTRARRGRPSRSRSPAPRWRSLSADCRALRRRAGSWRLSETSSTRSSCRGPARARACDASRPCTGPSRP